MSYNSHELKKPLSKDITDILIDLMHDGDNEARSLLIEHNLYIVKKEVDKINDKPYTNEYKDLFTNGTIALIKAIDKYSKENTRPFKTYLKYFCKLAVRNGLTGQDRSLTKDVDKNVLDINSLTMASLMFDYDCEIEKRATYISLKDALKCLHPICLEVIYKRFGFRGKPQSIASIARDMGYSETTIRNYLLQALETLNTLLKPVCYDDLNDISLEIIAKLNNGPDTHLRQNIKNLSPKQIGHLLQAIEYLKEKKRTVVKSYFGLNGNVESVETIAKTLHTRQGTVYKIIRDSFEELKTIISNMVALETIPNFNFINLLNPSNQDFNKNNIKLLSKDQLTLFKNILSEFPNDTLVIVSLFLGLGVDNPYKYQSIAEITHTSIATVHRELNATLEKMSKILDKYYEYYNVGRDVSIELLSEIMRYPKSEAKYLVKLLPKSALYSLLKEIDNIPVESKTLIKSFFGLDGSYVKSMSNALSDIYSSTTSQVLLKQVMNEIYSRLTTENTLSSGIIK